MGFSRFLRITVAAVGATLLAAAVVAVTAVAATPPATPKPGAAARAQAATAACDTYLGKVAKNLGKSTAQVKKALSDATSQSIDDQVKNGTLTQAQADQLKKKLTGQQVCSGQLAGLHAQAAAMGTQAVVQADVAKALGITPAELKTALQGGQTLQQVAASKGMDEAAFRAKYIATVKADLDKSVTAKTITQAQEDAALSRLQSSALPSWNRAPRPAAKPKPTPPTG